MLVPLIVVAVLVSIVLAEARVLIVVVAIVTIRRKVVVSIVSVGVRSNCLVWLATTEQSRARLLRLVR